MSKSRRARKEPARQQQKARERLLDRLKQGPWRDWEITVEPSQEVKMSVVLGKFIEPYVRFTNSLESYCKLVTLALIAWEASFLPEEEQKPMIDRVIREGVPEDRKLQAGLKKIVYKLLARKKAHFSQYRRHILDFEVTDLGDQYYLAVVSTPGNTSDQVSETSGRLNR